MTSELHTDSPFSFFLFFAFHFILLILGWEKVQALPTREYENNNEVDNFWCKLWGKHKANASVCIYFWFFSHAHGGTWTYLPIGNEVSLLLIIKMSLLPCKVVYSTFLFPKHPVWSFQALRKDINFINFLSTIFPIKWQFNYSWQLTYSHQRKSNSLIW